MLLFLAAAAVAGTVTLNVGVHRDAGSLGDIAVDGAAGQCSLGPARLTCPADGPVVFRWGRGGSEWELVGDTRLSPGQSGRAWLLAPDDQRQAQRRLLTSPDLQPEELRAMFVPHGRREPEPPSWGMLEDLLDLLRHWDPEIRVAAVEALFPWVAGSPRDFMPPSSPWPLPDGLLLQLANDHDRRVRARTARLIRALKLTRDSDEYGEVLRKLVEDELPAVRRAAMKAQPEAIDKALLDPEVAWEVTLQAVQKREGRAACNTLARLVDRVEPSETVDPTQAVELCLTHHTERGWRVWTAWRDEVPFRREWADMLLTGTLGMGGRLLRHWAETAPGELADALVAWEPEAPHGERFQMARDHLWHVRDPKLRRALQLPEVGGESPGEKARRGRSFKVKIDWNAILKKWGERKASPQTCGILAKKWIVLGNNVGIDGWLPPSDEPDADPQALVCANAGVYLRRNAAIDGDVRYAAWAEVSRHKRTEVIGVIEPGKTLSQIPNVDLRPSAQRNANIAIPERFLRSERDIPVLGSRGDGQHLVVAKETLVLDPGVYHFRTVTLVRGCRIEVSGPVEIHVDRDVQVRNCDINPAGEPDDFALVTAGRSLGMDNSNANMRIIAPKARARFASVAYKGSVIAKTVEVRGRTSVFQVTGPQVPE